MVYIFIVTGVDFFFWGGGGGRMEFVGAGRGYHVSVKFTHPGFIKSRNKNL